MVANTTEPILHRLTSQGQIYMQNLASIIAADMLSVNPGYEVLDLAAEPGGKTLILAERMQNKGRLAAVEPIKNRFHRLRATLSLHSVGCAHTYLKDGRKVGRQCPGMFDHVLIDAPCSSEARINAKDPNSYSFWSKRKINEAQRKQKQLLFSAIQATRSGGSILYSTCSFAPEENEAVVHRQLQLWGDAIEVLPLNLPIKNTIPGMQSWRNKSYNDSLRHAVRILPNKNMHGFFMCHLRRII